MDQHQERLFLAICSIIALAGIGIFLFIQPCSTTRVEILGANFESSETIVLSVRNTGERALDLVVLVTSFGKTHEEGTISVSAGQDASRLVAVQAIDKVAVRDRFCPNVYAELSSTEMTSQPSL